MKSSQIWITAGTPVVSFALGMLVAPSLRKSDVAEIRQTKSGSRSPSGSQPDDAGEVATRTRVGWRDDKKKVTEPRITLPLKTVAGISKEQQSSPQIQYVGLRVEKALPLLGVSEQETTEILGLFRKLENDV